MTFRKVWYGLIMPMAQLVVSGVVLAGCIYLLILLVKGR